MLIVNCCEWLEPCEKDLGIEIEVEGDWGDTSGPACQGWRRAGDGSLRNGGVEYVTSTPIMKKEIKDYCSRLARKINKHLDLSERCGVHVHVNCQYLTVEQTLTFLCCLYVVEKVLLRYCGEDRTGNVFCMDSKGTMESIFALGEAIWRGDISYITNLEDNGRYGAINPISLKKYGTVEIRCLGTPEDINDVTVWAETMVNIKEASKRIVNPKKMLEMLSSYGTDGFLQFMLGEHWRCFRTALSEQDLFEQVDLIQRACFTPFNGRSEKASTQLLPRKNTSRPVEILRGIKPNPLPAVKVKPLVTEGGHIFFEEEF